MDDTGPLLLRIHEAASDFKPADYLQLARDIRAADGIPGLQDVRVAFLSSFSLQFIEPFLTVEAARHNLRITSFYAPFGQFEQVLADPEGRLYDFSPDAFVLVMRPEDIDPDAMIRYHAAGGNRRFEHLVDAVVDRLADCVRFIRRHSTAPVLVANFAVPDPLPLGIFDANASRSVARSLAEGNERLYQRVAEMSDVVIWDYAGLVRSVGTERWADRRLWALGRIAVAISNQPVLASHLTRTLCGVWRTPAKCLILDLDNTLWGGVIGDDGIEGIQLGDDYPGSVYKSFQRRVLSLQDRGILLAIASKNDEEVVREVFDRHPDMLIRWDDLSAVRINWRPKSDNIREIAEELNIGRDSLVLFDDNPVERAEVRANLPEVHVIEVPSDPLRYEEALISTYAFDSVRLSAEDTARARLYSEERQRRTFRRKVQSVEEFLQSLDMVAEVERVGPATLARAAQLVAKTNQFNLTTRRHSQAQIEAMCADPNHVVCYLRLRDRFGDMGLVAVSILIKEGSDGFIDTFVMSCRIMNRRAERALVSYLADEARRAGCRRLVGEYRPTRKNAIVRSFYPELGFESDGVVDDGGQRFTLDLLNDTVEWPAIIGRVPPA